MGKQFQQFHDRRVVEPKNPCDLTYEQPNEILPNLIFIKLKNNEVNIKGQGCAIGRNQRNWLSKENTTFPTVSTEGLMLSCMIDAMEGCDVVTADIPGDFLQTG